ncbi:MAG: radical SAM protein [Deltaproteobacteria bacterium]|nr:radical SAM protein [Deltaproteobacteria bacterium]
MQLSRSAIVAKIPHSEKALLVQPLNGQVALMSGEHAKAITGLTVGAPLPESLPLTDLQQAGFAVDSDDQDRALLAAAWVEYLSELERSPTQLIVVPTFGCNLQCTYCYQEAFDPATSLISPESVDAFFRYVDRFHATESPRPYLTLFGGEPLVDTNVHHDRLERFLKGARERSLEVAVVTNGYDLTAFVERLGRGPVKEIQVTIDGPEAVHDARRPHASGAGTFGRVVRGIDALVAAKIPVNMRVVADKENLPTLPALAELAERRGWLDLPETLFKTQVGRNYELFGCAARQKREQLFDRVELWSRYLSLAEEHPALRRFHKPRLHGMRHLAETGEFPAPNFDACPAAKKEWAFGPGGGLYGCTATVGNPHYRLGSYAPEIARDEAAIELWSGRNVLSIPECSKCSLATVCGGGCGAIAAHRTGHPRSPDCRPVRELFGLGAKFYGLDRE